MSVLTRRRHKRLRGEFASTRRRVESTARAALRAQRSAIRKHPERPPAVASADDLAKRLRTLARELNAAAGDDPQVKAAARGVTQLARAYADVAGAARERDLTAAGRLTKRSLAALAAATRERRKAGDAWPL